MFQLLSLLYASGSLTFSGSQHWKVLSPSAFSTALGLRFCRVYAMIMEVAESDIVVARQPQMETAAKAHVTNCLRRSSAGHRRTAWQHDATASVHAHGMCCDAVASLPQLLLPLVFRLSTATHCSKGVHALAIHLVFLRACECVSLEGLSRRPHLKSQLIYTQVLAIWPISILRRKRAGSRRQRLLTSSW